MCTGVDMHTMILKRTILFWRGEEERLHPVIIDFGKSVAFSEAKNPPPKPEHLKSMYKDSYIAPELVNDTGKPSVTSDVYSLAFLVKKLYGMLNFSNIAVVKSFGINIFRNENKTMGLCKGQNPKLVIRQFDRIGKDMKKNDELSLVKLQRILLARYNTSSQWNAFSPSQ